MATETFARVYRLPPKLTNGFCFGGGKPITFQNVDWFDVPPDYATRERIEKHVRSKNYFAADAVFLVLCDDPRLTFTIGEVKR